AASARGAVFSCAVLVAVLCCGDLGAADEPEKDKGDEARQEQLEKLKRSAAQYTVSLANDRKRLVKFHGDAVLRCSNPTTGIMDGSIYLWSNDGRPQAILKLYTWDGERFSHEWHSLSECAIVAERGGKSVWNPDEPGINCRELADAPKPAAVAA